MKNKTLKSRKLLVMVALIVMVALVLGMGAMTYSKYVTKSSTQAQLATAAKWGYVINLDATNLFGKNYTKAENSNFATVVTENGVAVKANGDANVVAPGTSGEVAIKINGSADVKAQISFNFSLEDNKYIKLGNYEPIKWTLKKGETVIIEPCETSKLANQLEAITDTYKVIDAGNTLDIEYTLSWEWDFEDSENNIKETIIGYKASGKTYLDLQAIYGSVLSGYVADETAYNEICTELLFSLSVSVEQIQ